MATSFAKWFEKIRKKKGLTQIEAATVLGLSGPTISRWEGDTEPRASHLLRICKWAPISPEKLLKILAKPRK